MANADAPFGFRPISMLDGSPYNGGTIKCVILGADTTNTFVGDAVDLNGTSDALGKYPSVVQTAGGGAICFGVIGSFDAEPSDLSLQYASGAQTTDRTCNVIPALDVIFEIQEDSAASNLDADDVGQGCDLVIGTGSTVTGYSAMELDSSDGGTGDKCLILGIVDAPDNELGANCRWKVRINESSLRGTGTPI
jgi:hypothetical protein